MVSKQVTRADLLKAGWQTTQVGISGTPAVREYWTHPEQPAMFTFGCAVSVYVAGQNPKKPTSTGGKKIKDFAGMTPKQRKSTLRNFRLMRLRGMYSNANTMELPAEIIDRIQYAVDEAIAYLGGEPEGERRKRLQTAFLEGVDINYPRPYYPRTKK